MGDFIGDLMEDLIGDSAKFIDFSLKRVIGFYFSVSIYILLLSSFIGLSFIAELDFKKFYLFCFFNFFG